MIYVVTNNKGLFKSNLYSIISLEKCLSLLKEMPVIQVDSETDGLDCHINSVLCIQFGNDSTDCRIVVDAKSVNLAVFKEILEEKYLIFQNGKFDLQFLYNYGIHPLKVYDTMIVEQFLHIGYPKGTILYSLKDIAKRRLGIDLDKTVRGQIIWRGLDEAVIKYAALDVTYLERIMQLQLKDLSRIPNAKIGAKIECDFTPVIAYLEWCGIKLDENRWKAKMARDKKNLEAATKALNAFVVNTPSLKEFTFVDTQGDLFAGYNLEPVVTINWSSSQQVIKVAKILGFNTVVKDKKTGEDKDSVLEKLLKVQKGINDEFLKLYFNYQEFAKVVSSFGQGHLNAVNPNTGRIHTIYRAIGTKSGRMSSGDKEPNYALAKLKHLEAKKCPYVNMQQLPHDKETRACFIADKGNKFVSCDYSAQEGRVQGDIYQDEAILKMYREGIDGHSMYAKIFFKEELKDIDVHDVEKLRPDLRSKAKSPEFALAYGGGWTTIMSSLQCSAEEAKQIVSNYEEGFKGTVEFAKRGSKFVRNHGYIEMCKATGHRMYWWDWDKWKEKQKLFTPEFWEDYTNNHKGTEDDVCMLVKQHFGVASKYDRLARNAPAQGTSAVMTKTACIEIYKWIIQQRYFNIIKLVALVHDETCWEYPEKLKEFPGIVKSYMEKAASTYCKSLPIPAKAEVGDCWIH